MSQKIPPKVQQYLKQLDDLQKSYAAVISQKQSIEAQLNEIKNALEELGKATEGTDVFKIAGSILVRVDKDSVTKELEESKELFETRLKVLENQEKRLVEEMRKINNEISRAMGEAKLSS
jgi:prefoldin beta subunit